MIDVKVEKISEDAFSSRNKARQVNSVDEEYDLLRIHAMQHYAIKNAFPVLQKLINDERGKYDVLIIKLQDGTKREYWFDISSFFRR
jgi:hypothetical protein